MENNLKLGQISAYFSTEREGISLSVNGHKVGGLVQDEINLKLGLWKGVRIGPSRFRLYMGKVILFISWPPRKRLDWYFMILWRPGPKFFEVQLGPYYHNFKLGGSSDY